jgi:tRNA/tmRNA/rRNA uracil-C5-methylase (TrmA/RlmC/RlmD family)
VEVQITALAAGGDGIGRLADGKVVFVEGALPGETVNAEIAEERHDFARARTVAILRRASARVEPPCPGVGAGCGGCQWQHADPRAQLEYKVSIVVDALARIAHLRDVDVAAARSVPTSGYRTTARPGVSPSGRAGYRRRGGHQVIGSDECIVAHPRLAPLITEGRFPGAREVLLRVGVAGGERVAAIAGGRSHDVRLPADVTVVDAGRRNARAVVHEDVGGRRWRISVDSFFQSGPAAAELLSDAVDEAVGDALGAGGRLIDAYAGVGLLGGLLACRRSAQLVSVEQHRGAVADASINLADLDAKVVSAEVARWRPSTGEPVDVVVADPPRTGLGRPGVAALSAAGAPRLVLVSCDPASLARDATLLGGAGYALTRWQVVDLFPHTAHIEVVARFDR